MYLTINQTKFQLKVNNFLLIKNAKTINVLCLTKVFLLSYLTLSYLLVSIKK